MKTETQIAKENIENFKDYSKPDWDSSKEHKQSCERFLKFLKDIFGEEFVETEGFDMIIKNKITDLKKAIKLYKENRL